MGIIRGELDHRSVCHNFFDYKLGVLRLKSYIAAKRRNVDMPSFRPDARNMPRQNSQVAAFNHHFIDRNQSPVVRAMTEHDTFENRPGDWEIGSSRASYCDAAIACFRHVLYDRLLGKRPNPIPKYRSNAGQNAN